jgi:hypothetical protein
MKKGGNCEKYFSRFPAFFYPNSVLGWAACYSLASLASQTESEESSFPDARRRFSPGRLFLAAVAGRSEKSEFNDHRHSPSKFPAQVIEFVQSEKGRKVRKSAAVSPSMWNTNCTP